MSIRNPNLLLASLLLLVIGSGQPSGAPTTTSALPQLDKAARRCQAKIAQNGRRFAAAKLRFLRQCLNRVPALPADKKAVARAAFACGKALSRADPGSSVARARSRAARRIVKACRKLVPSDIDSPCDPGLTDFKQVAACVLDRHAADAERMVATIYSDACARSVAVGMAPALPFVCASPALLARKTALLGLAGPSSSLRGGSHESPRQAEEAEEPRKSSPFMVQESPPRRGAQTLPSQAVTTALAASSSQLSPLPASSFPALDDDDTAIPPDTHGAVGPHHLMVTLNTQVRVQDRAGGVISTVAVDDFWMSLDGPTVLDPKVLYDARGGRWIFTAAADVRSATAALLVGVSQTSDPTAGWNLYRVDGDAGGRVWIDYPSPGFSDDWIVVQADMFMVADDTFARSHLYVFDKADLYAGGSGFFTLFSRSDIGRLQVPAITYDVGTRTVHLVQSRATGDGLQLYTVSGPVRAPVFTSGPVIPAPDPWWSSPQGDVNFAPQLGSTQRIHTGDARIQSVVHRNGALWAAHTIFLPAAGPATRSAVQWWQFRPDGTLLQHGRVDDPAGFELFAYPSIAVNKDDAALVGYSRFSPAQFPSANYAFRGANDAPGALRRDAVLKPGEAPYFKTTLDDARNRWGDYSQSVVDPLNDTDLWTIQAYAASPQEGRARWGTWWGRLVVEPAGCDGASAIAVRQTSAVQRTSRRARWCRAATTRGAGKFAARYQRRAQVCFDRILAAGAAGRETATIATACARELDISDSGSPAGKLQAKTVSRIARKCRRVTPLDLGMPCESAERIDAMARCILGEHVTIVRRMLAAEYGDACALLQMTRLAPGLAGASP